MLAEHAGCYPRRACIAHDMRKAAHSSTTYSCSLHADCLLLFTTSSHLDSTIDQLLSPHCQQTSKPPNQSTSKPPNQSTSKPPNQSTSKPPNQSTSKPPNQSILPATLHCHFLTSAAALRGCRSSSCCEAHPPRCLTRSAPHALPSVACLEAASSTWVHAVASEEVTRWSPCNDKRVRRVRHYTSNNERVRE
jgi:hypothetical protein